MHRLPLGICCSLALRGLGVVVPFLKRRRHNEDEDRSAIALRSRPKEEDDSTTDQARKLWEENKSGPPDQEDSRPSTLCQSIGSCAGDAAELAANKPENERKPKKAAPKNSAPEDDVAQPHAETDGKERDAGAADETKPTPVGVPVFVNDVGGSCPPGHRPMTRIECAAGPKIDGKTYYPMAREGCEKDWWPNTGCFTYKGACYFSTCGRGRPQTTKGPHGTLHKGICLPSGTTSLQPILENGKYKPEWSSIDSRPLPGWFDDAKFGIFIHWGVYSVPAHDGGAEAEWYGTDRYGGQAPEGVRAGKADVAAWQAQHYPNVRKYEDFAKLFTAKKFVPADWAGLFEAAGAKYVVLTTKHHDGFCLWPSKRVDPARPNWNSMELGPRRDLVGELANATRAKKLKFGVCHSLPEWWNPVYGQERQNNWSSKKFPTEKTIPELRDLLERYKPSLIWSDGGFFGDPTEYWTSREFLAWLYNESPLKDEIVTNDRWGPDTSDRHGGYYSGGDRQKADTSRLKHKWESADTLDKTNWGYNKDTPVDKFWTAHELIRRLVAAVAYGGNYLLNVGPTAEGVIIDAFQDRLKSIGSYLSINGEAVYKTRACEEIQEQSGVDGGYYTAKPDKKLAYLHVVPSHGSWPSPGSTLQLTGVKSVDSVHLLTADGPTEVKCTENEGHVQCKTPTRDEGTTHKNGFALKLKGAVMQGAVR